MARCNQLTPLPFKGLTGNSHAYLYLLICKAATVRCNWQAAVLVKRVISSFVSCCCRFLFQAASVKLLAGETSHVVICLQSSGQIFIFRVAGRLPGTEVVSVLVQNLSEVLVNHESMVLPYTTLQMISSKNGISVQGELAQFSKKWHEAYCYYPCAGLVSPVQGTVGMLKQFTEHIVTFVKVVMKGEWTAMAETVDSHPATPDSVCKSTNQFLLTRHVTVFGGYCFGAYSQQQSVYAA